MTLIGASILMIVSLIEITYYIGALFPEPEMMTSISLKVMSARFFHCEHLEENPRVVLPREPANER